MRNIWIICRKELHSYFTSPVAYLLLTMFAIIFGFFFWNSVGYFNMMSLQSQMRGQSFPMSVNEYVIRPLLSNISVICVLSAAYLAFRFKDCNPDWRPLALGYLGLLLQAGGLLAVGTFMSPLTKNQIIAGAGTFAACLMLW